MRLRHIILFLLMAVLVTPVRAGILTDYLLGGSLTLKNGRKLLSKHEGMIPTGTGYYRRFSTTDLYIDGLIVRDGEPLLWQFDGGYVSLNANATPTSWNYYITDHLGSTRKVVDSNNNIKETINYYPFGSEMRMSSPYQIIQKNVKMNLKTAGIEKTGIETGGFTFPADSAISIKDPGILMPKDSMAKSYDPLLVQDYWQPYRFSGKELDKQNGLNWYDFGARWFDVAGVPMWTSVDPLAEKYYHISPYVYCNNNPVMLVDPDGREFTESSWEYVNMLLNNINARISNNADKIADIQTKLDGGGLSEKKVKTLQNKIKRLETNSAELRDVQDEIEILEQSSQIYDVALDNSRNNSDMFGIEVNSVAYFNPANGVFEIRLGDRSLGLMAHELKHAYQFEIGAYSIGMLSNGAPFYDQSDEWEAYKRGELFGGERLLALPQIYSGIQTGPIDYKSVNPIIMSDLKNFAKRTKSAFRVNGVTYNGIP